VCTAEPKMGRSNTERKELGRAEGRDEDRDGVQAQ
jgi:hypothetical protein